jgi:hypothetical protein
MIENFFVAQLVFVYCHNLTLVPFYLLALMFWPAITVLPSILCVLNTTIVLGDFTSG